MSRDHWTHCPECHYPMLELNGFEGVSSNDAAGLSGKGAQDYWLWGLWAIAHDILEQVWNVLRSAWRKHKVKKLRAELLPQFPNTLICPQCLYTIKKP